MSNIKTLIAVNNNAYSALKNEKDIEVKIGNYELISYKRDFKTDHGGIAYYNPDDKSVIIAHRGSATLKDWLNHNPKIALEVLGRPIETMADVSGKRFTNQILEQLDRGGNEIGLVINSGHSLGGRISQHSLIEVTQNLNLNSKSLTFNSAPIKNPTDRDYKNEHINLKLSGGSIYNTDIVSSFGNQLGENYKVISQKISNPISAHSLKNFSYIENENNKFVSDDLQKIFDHVKSGKMYADYPKDILQVDNFSDKEKSKTIYSLASNSASDKSKVIQNDADRGTTVSLVSAYDKTVEKITGNEAGEDGKLKSVAREILTFDKVDGAKILAWNTIDHVAGSGAISTAVKTGIVAHEIVKGSDAIGKGINSETNNIEHFCSSPEINNAVDKHFISDGENKDRKFFISQEDALKFYQENYKEIDQTINMQKNILGYSTKEDFLKESPYFSEYEKENIEKTLNNQANDQQKEIQASLAEYALDSTIYDRQFFADMQKDIQQDYEKNEVYIFLSDSDSQIVVYRSDMFMDDQKHEMQIELDTKVFDRVEQVEDYLEANESLLQQKVNKLNVVDSRANPQALTMKGMLQNKLNNVRGDIAELKPFHSVTATPLGTDKNNVILVDTKNDNLYSVSKNKIVGHDIDLDDILKNHKNIELFNNGNKIEAKGSDNTLHNSKDNASVKQRSSEKGLDLDI